MKTCRDCKHRSLQGGSIAGPFCRSEDAAIENIVHGRMSPLCSDARDFVGKCGPEARFWEYRKAPGFFREWLGF